MCENVVVLVGMILYGPILSFLSMSVSLDFFIKQIKKGNPVVGGCFLFKVLPYHFKSHTEGLGA